MMRRTLHHPLEQMMLKKASLLSEVQLTCFLLHHKYIDFGYVLFHNVVTAELHTQRLQSALTERSPRAVVERTSWKHGGREPFNFPVYKAQGS